MECILLGSGGMMPMPYRLLTSLAVRVGGDLYVFDAGEGTQINWKRLRLGVSGLKLIAITHLHADHCLGLPGLMMLKAQMGDPRPLTIIGPPGIEEFVQQVERTLDFYLNYPVQFIEWSEASSETAYVDEQARILWRPLKHTRFCLGYRLEEHERPGRFHPEKARELLVPEGRLWGLLQKGEPVTNTVGQEILPEQVLGPPRRGRHVAFVVDTRPTEAVNRLCEDVDIAFLEGMFLPEHSQHAEEKGHMTVAEAAAIAREAQATKAVLVHISPRYQESDLNLLETAARATFAGAQMGRDAQTYPVRLTH